jgi:hypothetical protein
MKVVHARKVKAIVLGGDVHTKHRRISPSSTYLPILRARHNGSVRGVLKKFTQIWRQGGHINIFWSQPHI